LLFEAGCGALAKKVAKCNGDYFTLVCENGHCARSLPSFRCRNRLCPYCAAERQRRAFLKFWPIVRSYAAGQQWRAVLITLTLEMNSGSLIIQDKRFKAAFRRLRRIKRWRDRIHGALCSYEFTITPKGWHYHVHILAFRKAWYDQTQLAEDWVRATRTGNDTAIVDVRAISNLSEGLRATLQYCFKAIEIETWTANEVQQFNEMERIKLSDCFGAFRGLYLFDDSTDQSVAEPLFVGCPCPECGAPMIRIKIHWRELNTLTAISHHLLPKCRAGPHPLI
jgi:hypothetical protein